MIFNEGCLAYEQLKDKSNDQYGKAPDYDGGGEKEIIFSLEQYRSYYALVHGAAKKDFTDYCRKLEASGFALYSSRTAGEGLFALYTDNALV